MMSLERANFDNGLPEVKIDWSLNTNETNQQVYVAEEASYSDILGLCDETSTEVPDTEINLKCYESINDIWDSSELKQCRRKTNISKIRKLLYIETGNRLKSFNTLSRNDDKKKKSTKTKLKRHKNRKLSHKSLDVFATESLPLCQQLPQTPLLNVPPNSPFDSRKLNSSYDNPFVTCLLKIIEETRINNLGNDTEGFPSDSSQQILSGLPNNFCMSEIITIPDVESPLCQHKQCSQSDGDHVVPHVNDPMNAHSSNMFYDSDLQFSHHHRIMQSCINNDHVVPDAIEE